MARSIWNWFRSNASKPTKKKTRLGHEPLEMRLVPAIITVTNPGDFLGAHTGVTLRDAILAAETDTSVNGSVAGSGADTIEFSGAAAGTTIQLSIIGDLTSGAAAFRIFSNITINGGGNTINWNSASNSRLFSILDGPSNLTLNNLTITNFDTNASNSGGAILVANGTLGMNATTFSLNHSGLDGGALHQSGGTIHFNGVTMLNNDADGDGGGYSRTGGSFTGLPDFINNHADARGGAIYMDNVVGSVGISSTSTGNSAGTYGGYLFLDANANFTLSGTISGHSAQIGGALALAAGADLTLNNATLAGNAANRIIIGALPDSGSGGAIYLAGGNVVEINNSTFRQNASGDKGGAIYSVGALGSVINIADTLFGGLTTTNGNTADTGGALHVNGVDIVTLSRSAVANNFATNNGGGIVANAIQTNIFNSTISSNRTNNNGGAGGVFVNGPGAIARFVNSTVAFNQAAGVLRSQGTVTSANTIYANNVGLDYVGAITSLGDNLFQNAGGVTSALAGSDVNLPANIGALASNGGPTPTHALLPGSPALNNGSNAQAAAAALATDQRGANRIAGIVDIGAYELIDTVAPTASFTGANNVNAANAASNTTTVQITYNDVAGSGFEAASGINPGSFGINDITVSNGATVVGFSVSGNTVTYTVQSPGGNWAGSTQGTYNVSVVAGNVTDFMGNGVAAAPNIGSFVVDTAPPTAILTTPPSNINAATGTTNTVTVTVTYADTGSGIDTGTFDTSDLTVTNGATVTGFSAVGNVVTYTIQSPAANWSLSPQGSYTIRLVANAVRDISGNGVAANNSLASFSVNTIAPQALMTTQPNNITIANAAPGTNTFTITYSNLPAGAPVDPSSFGPGDVTVTNGATSLSVINVSVGPGNAVTYIVQAPGGMWTNPPQGLYTIAIVANSVFDTAGNPVAANPTIGFFTVDAFRPTATMFFPPETINTTYSGPQSNSFTIEYEDPESDVNPATFGIGDVTVTNGATTLVVSTAMVSGNFVTYTVQAPGGNWATAPQGVYTIAINGSAITDQAGNGIQADPNFDFFLVDFGIPTAALATPPVNINNANAGLGSNSFTITYTDAVSGIDFFSFDPSNVTVTNGTTTLSVTGISIVGNQVTYTVAPPGGNWSAVPAGTYTVRLNADSVFDFAGNAVAANANIASFNVDITNPTVSIAPNTGFTNASPILFTFAFNEPVTNFTGASVTVSNGTKGTFTAVDTANYTLEVVPTADGNVTVTVTTAAQDAAGNSGALGSTATVFSDRTGPSVTISAPVVTSSVTGPITFTVTYADPRFDISTLAVADVILNATGTAGAATIAISPGNGATRTVTLSDIYGTGTIGISLAAGTARDTVDNLSLAAGPSATAAVAGDRALAISQPPAPRAIAPGSTYVYNIDYGNFGNQISPAAFIEVTVPANGTFAPSASTSGWTSVGGGRYRFQLGNLGIGAADRVAFAVMYSASTPLGAEANFTATIADTVSGGAPVATSTVTSKIVDPNRKRWARDQSY